MNKFTPMQMKFIESFNGNMTEAAQIAGYAHPAMAGERLMRNDEILEAIETREDLVVDKEARVANREDRQAFWTKIMLNEEITMRDRLRASELLGKANADFIERKENTHKFLGSDGQPLQFRVNTIYVSPDSKITV